ncbi:DUF6188 family protein [Nocardia brasiliensis]|uniref:DUF6188 family protein n=1 Tax=Nocardia brasiliensis TaxID=37326 RepID=UPI0018938D26|nr:DUF6188 family protein [Nocardia brasiliensis]MBF6124814.1 hypothetical protein [Nocardia brasiliensis]
MELQLKIVGLPLATVTLAFTATMRFGSPDEFELQIEGELELRTSTGSVLRAPSNDYAVVAAELDSLIGSVVTRADASESDGLILEFSSGAAIHVPIDNDYEAWGIVGRDGSRVICTPGGEFAIWSANK